jgi:hypothetical protein
LLVGCLVLTGCGLDGKLFQVEVETELCAVELRLDFPGGYPFALTRQFTEDDIGFAVPEGFDLRIELDGMAVVAGEGVTELAFIERLRVRAESSVGMLAPLELIDAGAPLATELWFVEATTRANLVPYLRESSVVFEVELAGDLPPDDWSLLVDVCFSLEASYAGGL